uniref:Uncharacterized protein n=1 Tax=Anguilla anguilla TaxID=7936 RepID=A0A0E9RGF3_ANGAN
MGNNCNPPIPITRGGSAGYPRLSAKGKHTLIHSVWRACSPGHLRASQTLLLLNLVWLSATCPSKKLDAGRSGPRN